ncbi:hypothetical protein BAC2_02872 [uncultured bacterium]|nr:hypothetical protein BAC2_02872 [uncultured bacterium]
MKIQVGSLSEGAHEYRFRTDAGEIVLGEEFSGEVTVEAVIDKTGHRLALKARISAGGSFICDRCTAPFTVRLTPEYRMVYVSNETDAESLDPSEVQVLPIGLPVIDLTDDVRQTILLSVPLKLLCRQDCRGLCPDCGIDLNTGTCDCTSESADTRWEQLRGFTPDSN